LKAIISDIHSNLEALQAVMEDIQAKGIQEIYCLGDIIGYGPNPLECLDIIQQCKVVLLGNHDDAIFHPPTDFNIRAKRAIDWTRTQFETRGKEMLGFLKKNKPSLYEESVAYCHASPRQPLREYMFPRVCQHHKIMDEIFSKIPKLCFVGHSHIPGVFTQDYQFLTPEDVMNIFMVEKEKALINVGSVGQPRDRDPRAGYVTFDGDTVVFRRIAYDLETTMAKINQIKQLDPFLADRLKEGK